MPQSKKRKKRAQNVHDLSYRMSFDSIITERESIK